MVHTTEPGNPLVLRLLAALGLAASITSCAQAQPRGPEPGVDSSAPQTISPPGPSTAATPLGARLPQFVDHSPNGEWTAEAIGAFPPIWMRVYRADGSMEWTFSYTGAEWNEVRFKPVHWSTDGRYLYYTLFPFSLIPRIDGALVYMAGSGLSRLDLENGQVLEILPGEGLLQDYSISPDSTRLAHVFHSSDGLWLAIRDLQRGEERQAWLSSNAAQAGSIMWSSDASALVLLVTRGFSWQEHRTRMVLFDTVSFTSRTVLSEKPGLYFRLAWIDDHTIYFEHTADSDGMAWLVDLTTGRVSPTPSAYEPASG